MSTPQASEAAHYNGVNSRKFWFGLAEVVETGVQGRPQLVITLVGHKSSLLARRAGGNDEIVRVRRMMERES